MVKVLFVCLGNICRSPLAEGVMKSVVEREGEADLFAIDSAGTGGWHVGEPPDARMIRTAESHGVDISHLKARTFSEADFNQFDIILAMDSDNLHTIERLRSSSTTPVQLFRSYDPESGSGDRDVPDPYYGGADGFENVYQIVARTCDQLFQTLRES